MEETTQARKDSAAALGDPWGARARDWSEIEDENSRELFETVHEATGVGAGTRLLDVGCGSGLACALAAGRGARVSGIDASTGLVELARQRVPEGDFRVGDMESLPFDDGTFDVVTYVNSFFFAVDRELTLREAARVARAGGTIAVVMWTEPDRVELTAYIEALEPLMPPAPTPVDPFIDEAALETLARSSGLTPERTFEADWSWEYADLETALRGLLSPGLSVLATETSGEDAVKSAITRALEPYRTTDSGYRLENTVHVVIATR